MKRKIKIKVMIDILMAVLFLLLMNTSVTGVLLHEVLGVAILLLFVAHAFVNWQWYENALRRLKSGAVRAKAQFWLNAAVGTGAAVTVVTGVMISQHLFVPLAAGNAALWYDVHDLSAWVTLSLLIAHGALHWRWIAGILRRLAQTAGRAKAFAARAGVGLLAAGAVLSLFNTGLADRLLPSASDNAAVTQGFETTEAAPTDNVILSNSEDNSTTEPSRTVSPTQQSQPDVTLEEYLSKLYCTACHKHCPLSNPRCGKGDRQVQEATQDYYESLEEA